MYAKEKMKTLIEYLKEGLLDLDDQPEINDLLFSYIFNIDNSSMYEDMIDYLKSNSKSVDQEKMYKQANTGDVCWVIANDPKNPQQHHPVLLIGVVGESKSVLIYFDPNKNCVKHNELYSDMRAFCINFAFKTCPMYILKSKKLISGFKKLKY
jgi:hypothetical protein